MSFAIRNTQVEKKSEPVQTKPKKIRRFQPKKIEKTEPTKVLPGPPGGGPRIIPYRNPKEQEISVMVVSPERAYAVLNKHLSIGKHMIGISSLPAQLARDILQKHLKQITFV